MEWKTLSINPAYEVSDEGQVRRADNKHIMSTHQHRGYQRVWLSFGKRGSQKPYSVHRLVALEFVDGYFEGAQINHKDENKTNNRADNLEWCTQQYNNTYGSRIEKAIKHFSKPVIALKDGVEVARFNSTSEAGRALGILQQNICHCCNGRYNNKTAGGYEWRYAEAK